MRTLQSCVAIAIPIPIPIPCHRVIGADGSLTSYGSGCWRKQWLLDHERNMVSNLPITTQELQQ